MMPVASHQIPRGARVLLFTCDGCGKPASFGIGCNIREALRTGDVARAGRWFCALGDDGEPRCAAGKEAR